jgi:hypothetical protein
MQVLNYQADRLLNVATGNTKLNIWIIILGRATPYHTLMINIIGGWKYIIPFCRIPKRLEWQPRERGD